MTFDQPSSSPSPPTPAPRATSTVRRRLGLPLLALLGLVALAVPRVIAHDFGLVAPASLANAILAVVPLVVWVGVAVIWSTRPLVSLVFAGGVYGIVLALIHNLAWEYVWAEGVPRLGGNLANVLPLGVESVLLRGATTISSIATGVLTGVVCGLIAWGVQALLRRSGRQIPMS